MLSPGTGVFMSVELYSGKWSWNCRPLSGDTGERDSTAAVEISWNSGLRFGRVILARWSQIGRPLKGDTWGRDLRSPGRVVFQSVEVYLGDSLEMVDDLAVTLEMRLQTLLWYPMTEVFELVELLSGDVLEMSDYLEVTLGRETLHRHCCFMWWSWKLCLCKTLQSMYTTGVPLCLD